MERKELVSLAAAIIYAVKSREQTLRDIGTDVSPYSTTGKEIADAVRIAEAIVQSASRT